MKTNTNTETKQNDIDKPISERRPTDVKKLKSFCLTGKMMRDIVHFKLLHFFFFFFVGFSIFSRLNL